MGLLSKILSWAVLAIGILVPTVAVLDFEALTSLTRRELERHGMTRAESSAALRPLWKFVALGLFGVLLFAVACWIVRLGRGAEALLLGVPGVLLWRWAVGRADAHAARARRAAREAAAASPAAAEVRP